MATTSKGLPFVLATVGIDALGIGLIIPVMPSLLLTLGVSDIATAALWGGVMGTIYALMQFVCAPLLGNLSDRFGRRSVILWALAVMALDYTILSVAGGLWLILIGRAVAGITGATHATANAWVADVSNADERARRFGLVGAVFGLGFVFGPTLGGLVGEWHVRAPFMLAAGLAALNWLFCYLALPESLPVERRRAFEWRRANPVGAIRHTLAIPGLRRLLLGYLLFALGNHIYPVIWTFWGTAAFGWSMLTIGVSIGVYGVFMALAQGTLVQPAIARFGEARTVLISVAVAGAGACAFAFVSTGWVAFALLPLAAVSEIALPALSAIIANRVADDAQGELQGVFASLYAISNIATPMLYTGVFFAFTADAAPLHWPGAPFIIAGLLVLLVIPTIKQQLHIDAKSTARAD